MFRLIRPTRVAAAAPRPLRRRLTTPRAPPPPRRVPPPPRVTPPDADPLSAFAAAQRTLPRPALPEVARTLTALAGTGILSTLAVSDGAPSGSVVQTAADAQGAPLLALSSLSSHTRELAADPRCSLTLLAPGFASMADARVTLACVATRLEGDAAASARTTFLSVHSDAFWVDFGDFSWWRLTPSSARVVAGFGRAGSVAGADYAAASPDPVTPFSPPVCGHMNADHADAVAAMVAASAAGTGVTVERASMVSVDRLGFECDAVLSGSDGGVIRARVPFSAPADDRKALKDRLVELTRAAAAGKAG